MGAGRYLPVFGAIALFMAIVVFNGSSYNVRFYLLCLSVVLSGWNIFKTAFLHVMKFRVDANILVTIALIGLIATGKTYEAAVYVCLIAFFIMLQDVFSDRIFAIWSDKWRHLGDENSLQSIAHDIMQKAFRQRKENEVQDYSRVWSRHMLVFIFFMAVPFLFFSAPLSAWVNYSLVVILLFAPYNALVQAAGLLFAECAERAARMGIFSRHPEKLEQVTDAGAVIFEKTVMLSDKGLVMNNMHAPYPFTRKEVLGLVCAMVRASGHQLGDTIVQHAEVMGFDRDETVNILSEDGFNMHALVGDNDVVIGSNSFLERRGIKTYKLLRRYEEYISAGSLVLFVAINEAAAGLISFVDDIHPGMFMTSGKLRSYGMTNVVMLTHEKARAAVSSARLLGFTNSVSDISDAAKKAAVQKLHNNYGNILLVADAQKDGDILGAADISISVRHKNSMKAFYNADIVIEGEYFQPLAELFFYSGYFKNRLKIYKRFTVFLKLLLMIFVIIGSIYLWQAVLFDGLFGILLLFHCYIKTKKQ